MEFPEQSQIKDAVDSVLAKKGYKGSAEIKNEQDITAQVNGLDMLFRLSRLPIRGKPVTSIVVTLNGGKDGGFARKRISNLDEWESELTGWLDEHVPALELSSEKSEGLPPKRLGSNRMYRSRADLINKMKQLGAVEITTGKQFNDIKNSQWLHTAGYALDTNGNLVAQSYYGDKDGKWYYTSTRNFDSDYLPESKQQDEKTSYEVWKVKFDSREDAEREADNLHSIYKSLQPYVRGDSMFVKASPRTNEIMRRRYSFMANLFVLDASDYKDIFKGPKESNISEATKFGSGMAKRKNFDKTRNLGEILDVLEDHRKALKSAAEDVSKSQEDLEEAIAKLQEFDASTELLKKQSVKGIKSALALKNSPEVQNAGEIEKALKDVLSIIAADYKSAPEITQLMTVIDSRYASRGTKIITTLEGQISRAIEVDAKDIKDSIEKGEIEEEDVMKFVTLTSVSHGVQNSGTVKVLKPVLERMNALVDAATKVEEAVIDPKQFKELRDYVDELVKEASKPKDTIKTTITALDKDTVASVKQESKQCEGVVDKLKGIITAVKEKIAGLWDSFTSLFFSIEDQALESADVFDEVELGLSIAGISVTESKKKETLGKKFRAFTSNLRSCCEAMFKDVSHAGDYDDVLIYAEEAVSSVEEAFAHLGEACTTLKKELSYRKDESNMDVIGILADAITQIVADDESEESPTGEGGEEEEDSDSIVSRVEREYSPDYGEPERGGEPPESEEPEGPEV